MGIEPTTSCLASRCSATELHTLNYSLASHCMSDMLITVVEEIHSLFLEEKQKPLIDFILENCLSLALAALTCASFSLASLSVGTVFTKYHTIRSILPESFRLGACPSYQSLL